MITIASHNEGNRAWRTLGNARHVCSAVSRSVIWLPYSDSVLSFWNVRSGEISAICVRAQQSGENTTE